MPVLLLVTWSDITLLMTCCLFQRSQTLQTESCVPHFEPQKHTEEVETAFMVVSVCTSNTMSQTCIGVVVSGVQHISEWPACELKEKTQGKQQGIHKREHKGKYKGEDKGEHKGERKGEDKEEHKWNSL